MSETRARNFRSKAGAGSNINLVPVGAMFAAANPAQANANSYRPIQGYGDINLTTHNLYGNYNALQVTWARQKGRYTIQLNYAFQKAMGIVSTNGANTTQAVLDPFNLANNYGVQVGTARMYSMLLTRLNCQARF